MAKISGYLLYVEGKGKLKSASLIPIFCLTGYYLVYIDWLNLNNENLVNLFFFYKGSSSALIQVGLGLSLTISVCSIQCICILKISRLLRKSSFSLGGK